MKNFSRPAVRAAAVFALMIAVVVAVIIAPGSFLTKARELGFTKHETNRGLPNYDVRLDRSADATSLVANLRSVAKRDVSASDAVRSLIADGVSNLKSTRPGLVIEPNDALGNAEVISTDVWRDGGDSLTLPSAVDRPSILKSFLKENASLVAADAEQIDGLKVAADYTNPDGVLSFTHLEQQIGGVPVFAGEVKAGFDKYGRMIRVINNLAPGLDYQTLSSDFGDPAQAVKAAAAYMGSDLASREPQINEKESTDLVAVFGAGDGATTAEKFYFPTEPGVAVPAWRVLIWQPVDTYYVIVDAQTGAMLWRKNITQDQTQTATYNVYRNANAYIDVDHSPAPFTPGPTSPNGLQAPVSTRQSLTLIGNEGDLLFNNLGWVTDGTNVTDGNSNQAGVDRDIFDGIDATQTGSPTRVFTSSTWNPPPGNPSPGDAPTTTQAQRGAVIQMFYVMNRWHDEMYKRGFTEAARNFQTNNFGRGGLGNDRVRSEGQDASGTNNANFSTPADGTRPRMQMYIWTGPTPDYDGTADADVIIHEASHGVSNRLHGNSSGLGSNMSGGMGEGWGDFYGHTMLAGANDPINSIYTTGGYATYLAAAGYTSNYYSGIRRFPKAVIAFTGPNGKPHNPLTFRYLNSDCNTLIGTTSTNPNSAFPRGPFGVSQCDQVHNAGEIWSSALWEVRALMVQRLGFQLGTQKVLQVVTDGMKLAPLNPTFLQERDAIIAAATAYSAEDAADVREGFRRRGMGFSASIQSTSPAAVTEAFDSWPGSPTPTPTPTSTPTPDPTPTTTPTPDPTPTPNVTISGFVRKTNGKGLGGATVTLQGPSGSVTTTTSGNGSYSFTNVASGFTYTVTPSANRYTFTPTSQTIGINGPFTNVNFTGTR